MPTDPTKAKPQHPWDWPCGGGPEEGTGLTYEYSCGWDAEDCFVSCPVHAAAAAAGPFMVRAEESFRERVLTFLEKRMREREAVGRSDAAMELDLAVYDIEQMPTGQLDDARRMAKGK